MNYFRTTLLRNPRSCTSYMLQNYHQKLSRTKVSNVPSTPTSGYFIEFMKLLKEQKERPFLYSSKDLTDDYINLTFLPDLLPMSSKATSFHSIGINKQLVSTLLKQQIKSPLPVQIVAIPKMLKGKRAIIQSATGSGKTLTYLLPIIQNIGSNSCANLIVVPTRELASQVYAESLKYVKDKSLVSRHVSGVNIEHEKKLMHVLKDSKLLIGTPKMLLEIIEDNLGYFRKVKCIILDEVDKLLPFHKKIRATKTKPTEKILSIITYYQKSVQIVATSATISKTLVQELQDIGLRKDCEVIDLIPAEFKHGKVPENIKHSFTIVNDADKFSKIKLIARLFKHFEQKCVFVYIHQRESVEQTVDELKSMGLTATALYKELILPAPGSFDNFLKSLKNGDVQFVVATEETVRGMDFPFIEQVYLTYLPDSAESYLHVAGRVGRINKPGIVTTVLEESDEKKEKNKMRKLYTALGVKGKLLKY